MNKGVKLTTTIAYTPTTFQQTIDLIANGSLNVKDVVTDQIELDNIVESGFNQLVNDKSQAKILVRLNGAPKIILNRISFILYERLGHNS